MKNVFNASEELFFDILIIALLSFLYFNYISMSEFPLRVHALIKTIIRLQVIHIQYYKIK